MIAINLLSDIYKYSTVDIMYSYCRQKFGELKLETFYYTHFGHRKHGIFLETGESSPMPQHQDLWFMKLKDLKEM